MPLITSSLVCGSRCSRTVPSSSVILCSAAGQLALVAAALGGYGQSDHRMRQFDRRQHQLADRQAGVQFLGLGHGDDLPGRGRIDGLRFGPLHGQQLVQLDGLAGAGHVNRVVLLDRARENPHEAQLVYERIDPGFEDLGHQRALGVDLDRHVLAGLVLAVTNDLVRRQRAQRQGVEQLGHADAGLARAAQDRNQGPGRNGLDNQSRSFLIGRQGALEVALGHLFVDFDDRLDELDGDGDRIQDGSADVGGHLERADHRFEIVAVADRQVERHAGVAEKVLNAFDQRRELDVVRVHLADDEDPPQPQLAGLLKHPPGVDADAVVGVDHNGGGVDAVQSAQGLTDEVGIARRVEQIELLAGMREVNQARLDGVLVQFFLFVEIANAAALVDAGRPLDRAGRGKDLVGQHRLAGVAVATKGNVADILNVGRCHTKFSFECGSMTGNSWPAGRASAAVRSCVRVPPQQRPEHPPGADAPRTEPGR